MKVNSQTGLSTKMLIIVVAIMIVGIAGITIYLNRAHSQAKDPANQTVNSVFIDSQGVKNITVAAKNFSFSPKEIKIKTGDKVKLVVNVREGIHDLVIDELNIKTRRMQGPDSETLEFTAGAPATYEYYCSIGNHRQMGMVGNLIIE